jgi:CheY-like chemotaxis protein
VITDHAMPSMTGLELAEKIRQIYPGLPIILASGYVEIPNGGSPAVEFIRLTKPFSQGQLETAMAMTKPAIASVA